MSIVIMLLDLFIVVYSILLIVFLLHLIANLRQLSEDLRVYHVVLMIIFLPTSLLVGVVVLIGLILEKLVKGFKRTELAKFLNKKIL